MKIVRFTQVVEHSGRPHVHEFWIPPDRDPEFRRARQAGRLMTIVPGGRGKADVGLIGFEQGPGGRARVLIFPKSLQSFAGARVVGLNFDLVEQPKVVAATARRVISAPVRAQARATHPVHDRYGMGPAGSATTGSKAEDAGKSDAPSMTHEPEPPRSSRPPARPKSSRRSRTDDARIQPGRSNVSTTQTAPLNKLIRAVRAAMAELQKGKTVLAYQRLERAVAHR